MNVAGINVGKAGLGKDIRHRDRVIGPLFARNSLGDVGKEKNSFRDLEAQDTKRKQ